MSVTKRPVAWFTPVLFFLLASCSPFVKDGQPTTNASTLVLQSGETVGQTFTARDRGLNGVEVFLSPDATAQGEIRLHLRADSQSTKDISIATLAAQAVTAPGFYRFDFAPQSNSRGQDYFAAIELQGSGSLRVGTAPGDAYLDGALYQNGNPIDAQMTFRLVYDPIELLIGLAALMLTWLQVLAVAISLFVLPGWALLAVWLSGWGALSWGERLGLAIGLSVAIYPLLLLWPNLMGLHLGALYAWLPIVFAILVLAWHNRAWRPGKIGAAWRAWRQSPLVWSDLALIGLIFLIIFTRFWVIRSIDVPMWGDSYQHTMITQLIMDHGGLFDSWQPYTPYSTLTVQFGFPTAAAVFSWLTGTSSVRGVLWVGQILNVLAIIVLYPLAVRIARGNRWAGVGAVLIAGLLSQMPAFYVNWGRYAQLAGQAI
ncbi:MAG: hypothetical protein KGJ80_15325, partial [Chloroflexota bacterium]|nr:hypothetical protein [Chloroflexota bacterium]